MGKVDVDVPAAIAELKTAIKDIASEDALYEDDYYLLNWLKAGKFNLKKAEKKMRKAAKFRKENNMADLIKEPFPENFLEDMPIFTDAVTKDGSAASCILFSAVDIPALFKTWGKEQLIKLTVQALAQFEQVQLELNKKKSPNKPLTETSTEGGILVVDVDKLKAKDLSSMDVISTLTDMCKKLKKYFPGLAAKIIVVNCTSVIDALLKIARAILEKASLKFEIHSKDEKTDWRESVTSQIPAKMLREPFGGSKPMDAEVLKRTVLVDKALLFSLLNEL